MQTLFQKNPFSIYDFLGYLFPGCFFLFLIVFCESLKTDFSVSNVWKEIMSGNTFGSGINVSKSVFFVISSYTIGHLLSYLSTLTVERFFLWQYGYPSEFLLKERDSTCYWNSFVTPGGTKKIDINNRDEFKQFVFRLFLRALMGIFMFPVVIMSYIFRSICVRGFITKTLDKNTCAWISLKREMIMKKLSLCEDETYEDNVDYSRILYHYYSHDKNPFFKQRIDNYVALYGFLRVTTLIINLLTVYIIVISLVNNCLLENLIVISLLIFSTYISFLAYSKFYRRYTLEIFMFLISDKDIN